MKKIIKWKVPTTVALSLLVLGFTMSISAIILNNGMFVVIGQGIIICTCILWWVWVMLIVYEIVEWHQSAARHLSDIRSDLAEVKELLYQTTVEFD